MTEFFMGLMAFFQTTGYMASQGWHQAKLLASRVPVERVVREGSESPERLEKLRLLPAIKSYAKDHLNLVPGKSYSDYIKLDGTAVTWIVQAAERRRLVLHTWWFPVVGRQPYLGFFDKEDAKVEQKKMKERGYDTTVGGVEAFSMLGYLADPIYSTTLDGNTIPDLVNVILHELVHATIYVPNFSSFNENLANFVAMKGSLGFFRDNPSVAGDVDEIGRRWDQNRIARGKFREYLLKARKELESFYLQAQNTPALADDAAFLVAREQVFDRIAEGYKAHMAHVETDSWYSSAFLKGRINNSVILGYSLYEAHQEPFERALANAEGNVARLVQNLKACLKAPPSTEVELWARVENCR